MKKLALGAVAAAAAAAAIATPAVAGATGTTTGNSVYIYQNADYGLNGGNLDVDLQVSCTGGSGTVEVTVDQYYPETPNPLGAHGFNPPAAVVCDGRSRLVTSTIVGTLFDGGWAKAKATLIAPSGTKKTEKWIFITAR